jgi:cytochrome c biogenesis protein CcmG/thiol:disulfide interchange protein DsbE
VLVLGVFVASFFLGKQTGVTDPASWDLPAMGPTAEVQDRVTLADYRGAPTVVNFFASWCVECDRELPGFAAVSDELRDQVQFVGVASQETGNPMFMPERHRVDWWPLARDIGGANGSGLSTAMGARGMPLTAFYNAGGQLLHVQLGSITETQLRSFIDELYGIEV